MSFSFLFPSVLMIPSMHTFEHSLAGVRPATGKEDSCSCVLLLRATNWGKDISILEGKPLYRSPRRDDTPLPDSAAFLAYPKVVVLTKNALDASPKGRKVSLHTRRFKPRWALPRC